MQAEDQVDVGASLLAKDRQLCSPIQEGPGSGHGTGQKQCKSCVPSTSTNPGPLPPGKSTRTEQWRQIPGQPSRKSFRYESSRGNTASLGGARKAKEQHQFAELCAKEFLGKGSRQRETDR